MMHYDIFNGDADGILSLLQLRKADPKTSTLVTGVKRDIQLLDGLHITSGDTLTVLDISMEKNKDALLHLLNQAAAIFYADHHRAGEIPQHPHFESHIDLDSNMCTGLIVDRYLAGRYHLWAITAAYGDNLIAVADALANQAGLSKAQAQQLRELGTLLNYNGYGDTLSDLHFHPADLYQQLLPYNSPFEVIADSDSPFHSLQSGYQDDMAQVMSIQPRYESDILQVLSLPDTVSSRRVSGVLGNHLANQTPHRAHLILTSAGPDHFKVSLRAPLQNKTGAGDVCSQFETGGGRAAAAGINRLPAQELDRLIEIAERFYQS